MERMRLMMVGFTKECGGDIYTSLNDEKLQQLQFIAHTIVSPLIVSIGLICNCINLLILSYPSVLKGTAKIYIIALTIADLCALLALLPVLQRLNKVHSQSYTAAFYYAHLEVYLVEVFIRFSSFIVVSLSFDRYLAVCHPEKFNNFHSKKTVMKLVAFGFVIAIIITIPLLFIKKPCIFNKKNTYKIELWDTKENSVLTKTCLWNIYIWCYEIIAGYGAFLLIAFFNVRIIGRYQTYMKKKNELLNNVNSNKQIVSPSDETQSKIHTNEGNVYLQKRKQREENRLVFMLQLIVLLFFLTMTPSTALSIIYYTSRDIKNFYRWSIFRAVGNNLLMLYLTLNFFIYSFCHKEFRTRLKNLFCRWF